MTFVLSLICAPDAAELTPALLERVNRGLDATGARARPLAWLDPERAAEIAFDGDDIAVLEELRRRLVDVPVDVNVLRAERRRKKLLLSDMDATAIIGETLDELSTYTPDDPTDLWAGPACVGLDTACGKGGFLTAFELPAKRVYESRD